MMIYVEPIQCECYTSCHFVLHGFMLDVTTLKAVQIVTTQESERMRDKIATIQVIQWKYSLCRSNHLAKD